MNISWFILALISSVLFSVMILLMKIATKDLTSEQIIFYLFLFGSVMLLGYFLARGQNFIINTKHIPILLAITTLSVIANVLLTKSYAVAPNAAYGDAVMTIRVLIVFVLSIILLGAKFNLIGLLGSVLIIAGVILLSFV